MTNIDHIKSPTVAHNCSLDYNYPSERLGANDESLKLTGILQSTLDLTTILELFHDQVSPVVAYKCLSYANKEEALSLEFGNKEEYWCNFHLHLEGENIGELTFFRDTEFNDQEVSQLETMMISLVYPLRNALVYKKAIDKAHRDPLTGVNNRAAMDTDLTQELNLAKRHNSALAMIILDIDKFKPINDTYGHIAGDEILKRVAECMSDCTRGGDVIYRYGGEEFVALLRNTNQPGAKLLAERIRTAVESMQYEHDDFKVNITISAGLSSYKKDDTTISLLQRCDNALYMAKRQGRNRVVEADD